MEDKYLGMVCDALKDLSRERRDPALANATAETRLLGANAAFDSLALVSLLADLEGRIADKFDKEVVLADERAMSAVRSPFRSVGALAAHIKTCVETSG